MSGRVTCILLAFCLCLTATHTKGTSSRSMNRLVAQQPLMFGRRGINPNMNSLFFGKRGGPGESSGAQASLVQLRTACSVLLNAYEQVLLEGDNES